MTYVLIADETKQTFFWVPSPAGGDPVEGYPLDVAYVIGDLSLVSEYAQGTFDMLSGATSLSDAAVPVDGTGVYYLVRYDGSCVAGGSWQSEAGLDGE